MNTTADELLEMAERCLRGEETVFHFAEAVSAYRGVPLVRVMFGASMVNESMARGRLKEAHYAAVADNRRS